MLKKKYLCSMMHTRRWKCTCCLLLDHKKNGSINCSTTNGVSLKPNDKTKLAAQKGIPKLNFFLGWPMSNNEINNHHIVLAHTNLLRFKYNHTASPSNLIDKQRKSDRMSWNVLLVDFCAVMSGEDSRVAPKIKNTAWLFCFAVTLCE